jgi:hypothetical protein
MTNGSMKKDQKIIFKIFLKQMKIQHTKTHGTYQKQYSEESL